MQFKRSPILALTVLVVAVLAYQNCGQMVPKGKYSENNSSSSDGDVKVEITENINNRDVIIPDGENLIIGSVYKIRLAFNDGSHVAEVPTWSVSSDPPGSCAIVPDPFSPTVATLLCTFNSPTTIRAEVGGLEAARISKDWQYQITLLGPGQTLFQNNCVTCHGQLATTILRDRTVHDIANAIETVPQMTSLFSDLTTIERHELAVALMTNPNATPAPTPTPTPGPTSTPTPTPSQGATLYANNCASCHQSLANSTKKNRSASAITNAIATVTQMKNNAGLKALTAAQISAIATALGGAP